MTAKVAAQKLRTADDTAEALKLRISGKSVRDIAEVLGRSVGWVSESIRAAIAEIPAEDAQTYRNHLLARQEALIALHWDSRHRSRSARIIQASDKIIADLLGLNAPKRSEHTGPDGGAIPLDVHGMTDEQLRRVVAGLPPGDAGPGGAASPGGARTPPEGTPPV